MRLASKILRAVTGLAVVGILYAVTNLDRTPAPSFEAPAGGRIEPVGITGFIPRQDWNAEPDIKNHSAHEKVDSITSEQIDRGVLVGPDMDIDHQHGFADRNEKAINLGEDLDPVSDLYDSTALEQQPISLGAFNDVNQPAMDQSSDDETDEAVVNIGKYVSAD